MPSGELSTFWQSYVDHLKKVGYPIPEVYPSWLFCNNETSADALAKLVLAGTKTATASLLWTYQAEGSPIPKPGDHSIITLWDETPVCIIETTDIQIIPFDLVLPGFAYAEGEGDRSLDYWRRVHMEFFSEECAALGRSPEQTMPVVCEHFKVIYRGDESRIF
jgi:uncharacterized protein YhfF